MLLTRKELIEKGEDPTLYITSEEFDQWKNAYIHQKDLGEDMPDEDPDWIDEV